jgi:hypothetical protein
MSVLARTVKQRRTHPAPTLQEATVRQFDGGWNVIDSDLNLTSKYAKALINTTRSPDGALQVHWGTKLFADFDGVLDRIVNTHYYIRSVIAVDRRGHIAAADARGNITPLWSPAIAAGLPNAPNGWSATEFCSFTEFNGDLVICNGVDKPLLCPPTLNVRYLQDLGTGSNINVPIGRYVVTHNEYCIIAGDPNAEDVLHISNRRSSGTWLGDPIPNDAVDFPLGAYISVGSSRITGLTSFRDRLIVFFEESIAILELGIYDEDGNHTPRVVDVVANFGAISHRAIQNLGEDVLFQDIVGVQSLQRALLTNNLSPTRESQLIDPEMQRRVKGLTRAALEDRVFSCFNKLDNQISFFVPNDSGVSATVETVGFNFTFIKSLKVRAWNSWRKWNWTSACRTSEGRVIYSRDNKLFVYGNRQEQYLADYVGFMETFSDQTAFTDGTGWSPVADLTGSGDTTNQGGIPIFFVWELPWSDLKTRGHAKESKYIQLDTTGRARFTCQMYIDNFLRHRIPGERFSDGTIFTDGYGFQSEFSDYNPSLEMDFVGGDRGGFGVEPFDAEFGGGRLSSDERLYAFPQKFKLFKLRFIGYAMGGLQFVSITLLYNKLGIGR